MFTSGRTVDAKKGGAQRARDFRKGIRFGHLVDSLQDRRIREAREGRRFQASHLLAFGWITLAFGTYFSCKHIDRLITFRGAMWVRVIQYMPFSDDFLSSD